MTAEEAIPSLADELERIFPLRRITNSAEDNADRSRRITQARREQLARARARVGMRVPALRG